MPLIKDFYVVEHRQNLGTHHRYADITLNELHPVFKGHFPQHPVTPGVCMLQIIKELSEDWAGASLILRIAKNMKFLAIINPFEHPRVRIDLQFEELDNEQLSIRSTSSFGETIALKFHGIFQKTQSKEHPLH